MSIKPDNDNIYSKDDMKLEFALVEDRDASAAEISRDHIEVTPEDDKRICRKTDMNILPILVWMYFLQILDKVLLGYANLFGLSVDAHLQGTQYSFLGSIAPFAQLAWLPFSSYFIVRIPHKPLATFLLFAWGCSLIGMAFSKNYGSLLACRFLMGLFEAACMPLFAVITAQWYRRAEQPFRVALWFSTNGWASIIGAAGAYGLGHIKTKALHSYQIIFLVGGLLTVLSAPVIYWRLDNHVAEAKFLSPEDRLKAVERLKANQTGLGSKEFKVAHVVEAMLEPRTWGWMVMALIVNVGGNVYNAFGPVILAGLGFDIYIASLLSMPFGAVQVIVVFGAALIAYKFKNKTVIFGLAMIPVIIGFVLLYVLPRTTKNHGPLLLAYYLQAFEFAGNPLMLAWITANTAGSTKKAWVLVCFNFGVSSGNAIGPFLFKSTDAPEYKPGMEVVLILYSVLLLIIGLQFLDLFYLNKRQAKRRVKMGKAAVLVDHSMENKYHAHAEVEGHEADVQKGLHDVTDGKNEDFIYVY